MFFVGIFGVNQTQKSIGTKNNIICPACNAWSHWEIYVTYSYFHIFFIPVYKWNQRYYVKSACCSSIYELDPQIAQQYEKDQNFEIKAEHLQPVNTYLPYNICKNCKSRIELGYKFCPYCGQKL
jgi:RNA polymerase subunit RPABC4/transcription elongation factor Spt4